MSGHYLLNCSVFCNPTWSGGASPYWLAIIQVKVTVKAHISVLLNYDGEGKKALEN